MNNKKEVIDKLDIYINKSKVYQMFFESKLNKYNIYKTRDSTFGRSKRAINPKELYEKEKGNLLEEGFLEYENLNKSMSKIYYQTWQSIHLAQQKADIVFIHGLHDHSGRIIDFLNDYLNAGFRVHCIDLPGHGRSDGIHGHIKSKESLIRALEQLVLKIQYEKLYLLGDGLGGLVSILFALTFPHLVHGLVLFSPFKDAELGTSNASKIALSTAKILNKLAPRFPIINNKNIVNKDIYIKNEFINDPLTYHGAIRAKTTFVIIDIINEIFNSSTNLDSSYLLIQGKYEAVLEMRSDPNQFVTLTDKVQDKTLEFIDDGENSISTVNIRLKITSSITWISDRC